MKAVVTQIIKTVQGEGPSIGYPITLIRFAGCNLSCSFCDTKWALKIPACKPFDNKSNTYPSYEVNDDNLADFLKHLMIFCGINKRILFTGGEPLLYTKILERIVETLESYFFEIETNGLLVSNLKNLSFFKKYTDRIQLNISPKYDEYLEKYEDDYLRIINKLNINHNYKFIYQKDLEGELLDFIGKYVSKDSPMIFMPITPDLNIQHFELLYHKSCLDTVDFCIRKNYRFSPREHVYLFGKDRNENNL